MAERDDITHAEIIRLRDRLHRAENRLTAHEMMVDFVPGLVSFKDKWIGVVIGVSATVSAVTAILTAVVVKMIG